MEKERLIGAVKELNESGLLENKIRWVAVKQEALAEAFMVAVEQIPEADEEKIPDMVAEVYNALATGDDSATEPVPAPVEEKVDNKKKESTAKKEKKAAVANKESAVEFIRRLQKEGLKEDAIYTEFAKRYPNGDPAFIKGRFKIYCRLAK